MDYRRPTAWRISLREERAAVDQRLAGVAYGPRRYPVETDAIVGLRTLRPYRPVAAAVLAWASLVAIVKLWLYVPGFLWLYPVVALLIAGRAGVFLQLAHEAAHGLISKGRFNDWFGNWIACYPIGLDFKGYREPHLRHHACVNQPCDPVSDKEKYRVCDIRSPRLWLLFLKDISGVTALQIRFLYDAPVSNKQRKEIDDYLETEEGYTSYRVPADSLLGVVRKYLGIAIVQGLILGLVFNLNPWHYLMLWLAPLVTAHMFLMRIRGIAEHGLPRQLGTPELEGPTLGVFFTRSFGTPLGGYRMTPLAWIERLLIGSLSVYFHHEHHLYPKVPYYNLARLHALIGARILEHNPLVFARGYFACLFVNRRALADLPGTRAGAR